MINDLIIKPEILEILFLPVSLKDGNEIISMRINRNKILFHPTIKSEWDKYFSDKMTKQLWQDWLTKNLKNANGILKKCNKIDLKELEEPEVDIYLIHCKNNSESIMVGDYPLSVIRKNSEVGFIFDEDLRRPKISEIKLRDIEEVIEKKGRLKKWFSVFETKVDVQIVDDQDAKLVADYILKFIKGNEITIQDAYLATNPRNESNFDKYIYPHIKDKNITMVIAKEDGTKHKSRLEKKYKVKVNGSHPVASLHESFIEDEYYKVKLGYRFEIFGIEGKTRRESISVLKK